MTERSHQHPPFGLSHTRTRQASTSSSDQSSATDDKSTSSHTRRHRPSPALGIHQHPAPEASEPSRRRGTKQSSSGPREKSSKGSSTNMTVPLDPPGEVSYTPTTHRISKAKKGKKVHVCEFPGCNKVFTRAEHRKRHEANHNPEFAYQCQFDGCRKGFQRADLLNRHLERQHETTTGSTGAPDPHPSMSETSSNPPSRSMMPSAMGQPQPVSAQSMPHGPGAMAITSIIEHQHEMSHSARGMGDLAHTGIGPLPIGFPSEWTYGRMHPGDSPMYSSDCSSPVSDYPNAQISYQPFQEGIQRPPSTFSESSFHQGSITSPLSAGPSFTPNWGTSDGSYASTVGSRNLGQPSGLAETDVDLDSSLQLPVSILGGGHQWLPIQTQSKSPASVVMGGQLGPLQVQDPRTRHYLECYWQYFHPMFPIVRLASFVSAVPPQLLAASMVVIGAQFSSRPDAKQYSASLYTACHKMILDLGPVTSRSPISELQTIIHMELFSRHRARSATVDTLQASSQFTSLYESLIADQTRLQHSAASLQQALRVMSSPAQLSAAWREWMDVESRRRVLTAAFVLDTQHSHLVQQQASYTGILGEDHLDLPFPCPAEAWNSVDLVSWRDLIMSEQALAISSVDHRILPPLDPFQASLLSSYQLQMLNHSDKSVQGILTYYPTKSHVLATTLTFHALSLSKQVPLHELIITASESWLFGTKITDEAVWQRAKNTVRGWVTSDAAMMAVWHAAQLLRLVSQAQDPNQQHIEGIGYLHDLWCLYTAALVCWAVGYGAAGGMKTQQTWEPENAELLALEYLSAMNVPTWQEVRNIDGLVRRNTRGLLEWVRVRVGEVGMGGLLNGAEDVLFRLVEGESMMVEL